MKILLHICCGPCLLYPLEYLHDLRFEVKGHFFNPNIHPFREFKKRLDCLVQLGQDRGLPLLVEKDYGFLSYSRAIVFKEQQRCSLCYEMRLEETARIAKKQDFPWFSTTLLYSKYQQHELIKDKCRLLSQKYDVGFFYHDFRQGWERGVELAMAEGLYRQSYCGCIYSEQERYDNRLKKRLGKQNKGKKRGVEDG